MALEDQGATPEVEQVIDTQTTETVNEPVQIEDTIRDTLSAIRERGEAGAVGKADAPESPEEKAERLRDAQGKFAAKETPPEATVDPLTPAEPVAAVNDPVAVAPNTWKKEVAAKWAELPVDARAEIVRREADFHKGIEGYRQAAGFGQAMERTISPYAETIRGLGLTADKAVEALMAGDHKLRHGSPQEKTEYFAQLARNYGIDLGQVQQVEHIPIDPNLAHLQQQVQKLSGYIENQQSTEKQRTEAALHSEIATFAADPKHSHFESVKGHMVALLQADQAKTLADAYEQAVYANPTTRALVLAQQQAEQRAEAAKKATAAKAAASVNTRARPSMPVSQPIGSMDDTIRAKLREIHQRA